MAKAQEKAVAVEQLAELEGGEILDQMIETGIRATDDSQRERAQDLIKNFVE